MPRLPVVVSAVSFVAIACTLLAQRNVPPRAPAPAATYAAAVAPAAMPAAPRQLETEEEDESRLEIEVVGTVHDASHAEKYIVLAMASPCDLPRMEQAKPVGIDALEGSTEHDWKFGFEAVVDSDEKPYLCALAFDAKRRVIGFGEPSAKASPKPGASAAPLTVAREPGEEYGRAHGVEVTIHPVKPLVLANEFIMSRVH